MKIKGSRFLFLFVFFAGYSFLDQSVYAMNDGGAVDEEAQQAAVAVVLDEVVAELEDGGGEQAPEQSCIRRILGRLRERLRESPRLRAGLKALSWRGVGSTISALATWFWSGYFNEPLEISIAAAITGFIAKGIVYVPHERCCNKITQEEVGRRRSWIKCITWQPIAFALTFGIILCSTLLLDSVAEASLLVGVSDFIIKFVAYYLHQRCCNRRDAEADEEEGDGEEGAQDAVGAVV